MPDRRNPPLKKIAFALLVFAWIFAHASSGFAILRSPFDKAMSEAYMSRDRTVVGDSRALGGVVPHHDIAAGMMTRFYGHFDENRVKRIFILAPDHFNRARRPVTVCPDDWELSSGAIRADGEALEALGKLSIVDTRSDLFAGEHGVTVHIPLLAGFFPRASVVPIVLRPDIPDTMILSLRNALRSIMRDGDIVILSADLSHYKTPEAMAEEDVRTIRALTNMDAAALNSVDIDARKAAALMLLLLKDMGARSGKLLERSDISDILGYRIESGTSYAAVIYLRGE